MDKFMYISAYGVVLCIVLVHVHGQTNGPDMDPIMNPATCATTYCPPNSTCVQTSSYVYCDCVPGKTGINCTMDDPCLETNVNCPRGMKCFGPCNPNVFCQGATGIPQCTNCISGFKGTNCDEDEDECKEWKDVCKSNGKCTNTFGGYRCDCKVGYSGENCEICKLSEAECNENGRHSEEDASKKTESAAESFHIVNVSIPLTLTCIMSLWI
ncbi:neurogenic locus notch homolog protein 1-like isoform X2 [Dreissena polymorpha]|uniref:EGF-like domain-containing protein n=1 Tax=Dreissena polymorpha TaxID=45954 RepID=A0A9D3YA43_DREPO|nr:neurogenic locus notch homolog protein 1-like isoform X2 [Dreissena polymorpha]KAH3695446.1 hypothetical protein DPMN_082906 [Dreissena polymorpha]